ncbi:uncharacterized protein [Halyomorpha halys]|uniref:uncharacterized protein n=1 Tax=Halyomorpha halys TaxID=286706 RepID=UPI0006D4E918|nr:uncharacterized protein LOC106689976 [Halyomorpha halys]
MFKTFGLVLLSALVAVGGERVNFSGSVDHILEQLDIQQSEQGIISLPQQTPESSGMTHSDALVLGVDSLYRTNDCWQEVKGLDTSIEVHYGFKLLTIVLPNLEINGKNMSAYARVRDNSFLFKYTKHVESSQCSVTLDDYSIERMENIVFKGSRSELDDSNLNGYFKSTILPSLNKIIASKFVEIEAQPQYPCNLINFRKDTPVASSSNVLGPQGAILFFQFCIFAIIFINKNLF